MGYEAFYLKDIHKTVKTLISVSIPSLIMVDYRQCYCPHACHTLIIDLASKPGGTDFRYAEKRGIKALLAPSLPGIVAPKTAGQILANVLI